MKAKPALLVCSIMVLVLFSGPSPAGAQSFAYKNILDSMMAVFEATTPGTDDDVYWNYTSLMEQFFYKGQRYFRFNVTGHEVKTNYRTFEDGIMIQDGDVFAPLFFMRLIKTDDGKEICREETAFYDRGKRCKVLRDYSDPTKRYDFGMDHNADKWLDDLPPATYCRTMYYIGLMAADLKKGWRRDVVAVSRYGHLWGMQLKVKEIEEVTVPAGRFLCYRIKMTGNLSKRNRIPLFVMDALLPNVNFWVTVDSPHRMIQYYGWFEPPVSLSKGVPELVRGRGWMRALELKKMGIDDIPPKKELLERMKHYKLVAE